MTTENEKFLYTVHFMLQSEVNALAKMIFEKLYTTDQISQAMEDWSAMSRIEFRDLMERLLKILPDSIPALEMQAMANRIWSGADVPPESQS